MKAQECEMLDVTGGWELGQTIKGLVYHVRLCHRGSREPLTEFDPGKGHNHIFIFKKSCCLIFEWMGGGLETR